MHPFPANRNNHIAEKTTCQPPSLKKNLKLTTPQSRPAGRMAIARRFNGGKARNKMEVPAGDD